MSTQPLNGKRVLVTRSVEQAAPLKSLLEEVGAKVVHIPLISIVAPTDPKTLREIEGALRSLESYDWLIFTSTNGVDFFMHFVQHFHADVSKISAKVVAVGPKTAERLQQFGITSKYPAVYEAEGIFEHLRSFVQKGDRVLIPTSNLARDFLQEELGKLGVHVHRIHVYENQFDTSYTFDLRTLLQERKIDYITATSSSTVKNLLKALSGGVGERQQLLQDVTVFCIGHKTAETAIKLGIENVCVAEEATIEGLVECIIRFVQKT